MAYMSQKGRKMLWKTTEKMFSEEFLEMDFDNGFESVEDDEYDDLSILCAHCGVTYEDYQLHDIGITVCIYCLRERYDDVDDESEEI